jgi:hypothetical protein
VFVTLALGLPACGEGDEAGGDSGGTTPAMEASGAGSSAGLSGDGPPWPTRLVFVHHSCGENWLADDNGGLGQALATAGFAVSDTNYGWGSGAIGDRTDIGNWWEWFRGPESDAVMAALYSESGQNCAYTRRAPGTTEGGGSVDTGGGSAAENEVVMFKSCFPNSALRGSPDDPVPAIDANPLKGVDSGSEEHTVANAKGIYTDLLEYFGAHPEKLFVVITAPPLSDSTYAANARALNDWLLDEWLSGYSAGNVAVFDLYGVLTDGGPYFSAEGDDHPSAEGNRKATEAFVPWLQEAVERWRGGG